MKRIVHIAVTIIIMLIVSRFFVRIVDAAVQIDDDIGMLFLLLAVINAAIGAVSYLLYRRMHKQKSLEERTL